MENQAEKHENGALKLTEEQEFFNLIEQKLELQGYKLLETSSHLSGEKKLLEPEDKDF